MNIRMGNDHASSSEIEDAAAFACATEFIENSQKNMSIL